MKRAERKSRNTGQWLRILTVTLAVISGCGIIREHMVQKEIAEQIVRFHVKANSDDRWDQEVKLRVRDALTDGLEEWLQKTESKEETEAVLKENMDIIQKAAEQVVRDCGSEDPVEVSYGKDYFEEKSSGDVVLPAGRYDALEVKIGKAKGHNWWCMLYPSMCFSDALRPLDEPKGQNALREILSDAACRKILKSDRLSFDFYWFSW